MPTVESILSSDGPISRRLAGHFESRPEQIAMARAVDRAMNEKSHLLVEAGTGVGKSFAYLVPAIMRCLDAGEIVVVVTNTIALQEQLIAKDIPLLREILDPDEGDDLSPDRIRLKPVLVKGRGNYVSIRRLKLASQRQDRLFPDAAARRSLHVIEDWAYTTTDGTLSTLPPLERTGVWDKVQSDSGNCMGRRCPNHDVCFYQSARREMESANLLVCNHALFFSDLALRAQEVGFLPQYQHVIIDEAHNVEDVAAEHFGVTLSEGRVQHLLNTLYHPRTGKGYLSQLQLVSGDSESVDRAIGLVMEAQSVARQFFESVVEAHDRASRQESDANTPQVGRAQSRARSGRVRRPNLVANILTQAMNDLVVRLRSLKEATNSEPDRFELNAFALRASEIGLDAQALIEQTQPGSAYWVEVSGGEDSPAEEYQFRRVTLACAPIDVAPLLRESLFRQPHSVILTSATLATRTVRDEEPTESAETAFAHTITRLGCEGAKTLQLGSPFDYARQARVYVDRTSPHARDHNYSRKLADRVLHHVLETDGGAFVLFTSFATLNSVARAIGPELESRGMPLLVQGSGVSRSQLLEQFRSNDRSVLLGAASFWQGVDVRGHGLRNVIITKLPFDPPDRPLTEARLERIEQLGGDAFKEDSLPRAVIRFKQGFGRLIRSKSDTGRVVILDPRVLTTGYGKRFLDALPAGVPVMQSSPQSDLE